MVRTAAAASTCAEVRDPRGKLGAVSEIPVGSPPVPPGRHAAPGGWYADPAKAGQERYWDGWQWTRNVRSAEAPAGQQEQPGQANPYGHQSGQQGQQYGQGQQLGHASQAGPSNQYQLVAPGGKPIPADQFGRPLGNRGLRLLAKIIDSTLISILAWAACFPIARSFFERYSAFYREVFDAASAGQPMPATPTADQFITSSEQLTLGLVTAVVTFLYIFLFLRWKAATPGKLATGLRVVPAQSDGPLGTGHHLKRSLLEGAFGLFAPLALLDYLFPLWDPRRQALHDKGGDTLVVGRSAGPHPVQPGRQAQPGQQPPYGQAPR